MADPAETPAQAVERIRKEIRALRQLRAQLPVMILDPFVEDASKHIKEVAARLAVTPTIPASTAVAVLRTAAQEETKPAPAPTPPPTVPTPGAKVTVASTGMGAVVVGVGKGLAKSPPEWEVTILTEDGELLTVAPEELAPSPEEAGVGPTPTPPSAIAPGSRVRDKTTGKTGYVTEISDDRIQVALDEGGFVTRSLADLEPL